MISRIVLVVQHTVTIALKIRIRDLLTELLTDALEFLGLGNPARTVAAALFQSLADACNNLRIVIQSNCHSDTLLSAGKLSRLDLDPQIGQDLADGLIVVEYLVLLIARARNIRRVLVEHAAL